MDWHKRRGVGLMLRAGGLCLLGLAWAAGTLLARMMAAGGTRPVTVMQLVTAACMFGCASLGSALLLLGRHLFDRVRVSDRWLSRPIVASGATPTFVGRDS